MKKGILKRAFTALLDFIKETDIRILFSVPFIMALFIGGICSSIFKQVYGYIPDNAVNYVAIAILFLMGLSGVFLVIRREFPLYLFDSIYGRVPIVIGILWTLFFWVLACKVIIRMFN